MNMATPVVLTIPIACSGETHHAELTRDGELKLLNHPSIEMLQAFVAFDAKKPECLEGWETWRKSPMVAVYEVEDFKAQQEIIARLAYDFALAAVNRAPSSMEIPAAALESMRIFLEKHSQQHIDDVASYTSPLQRSIGGRRGEASIAVAKAALNAITTTFGIFRNHDKTHEADWARDFAARAMVIYDSPRLRDDFRARSGEQRAALSRDPEYLKWYEKHARKQRRHIARALYAHLEGKPWPAFS